VRWSQPTDDALRRELAYPLDLLEADYRQLGLPAKEARRRALITFGGPEQIKEQCQDTRWYAGIVRASRVLLAAARGR
jgi:hypothetical protein